MSFNRPSDGQFDGRNNRSSEPYYPQIYDQSNRQGSQHSPTRIVNNTVPLAQPQRETAPVEKFRAAATAAAAANAGSSSTRPPSYPGLMSEHPTGGKQQPQFRGYRRDTSENEDEEEVEPQSRASIQTFQSSSGPPRLSTTANKSSPVAPSRSGALPQARGGSRSTVQASSSPTKAQGEAGNSIQRPASTTIMSSVLKPLSSKIQQYSDQMADADDMIEQLDAEMEKLQARRKEAEARFTAAKTKHDDYQRQYQGVERAMRGEPDMQFTRLSIESSRPTTQQTVQTPIHPDNHSRTQSWGSQATNQYAKNGSKSRLSKIFGL